MTHSRRDLENLKLELEGDKDFCADLTNRSRPGHELALRQWNAINSKLLELDGLRPAATDQELRDAFTRQQNGSLPPEMQAVQNDLRTMASDLASPSAGGRSAALIGGDKFAKAKATRDRILKDPELTQALTSRKHPKHAETNREYMEATSVLEAADAAKTSA